MTSKKSRMKTALVLSGGGARGAFEVGVLRILETKIIPDVIIATSVGSINAAMYTTGHSPDAMEKIWLSLTKKMLFPFNRQLLYKFHLANSIANPAAERKFMFKYLGRKTFDDTSILLY